MITRIDNSSGIRSSVLLILVNVYNNRKSIANVASYWVYCLLAVDCLFPVSHFGGCHRKVKVTYRVYIWVKHTTIVNILS